MNILYAHIQVKAISLAIHVGFIWLLMFLLPGSPYVPDAFLELPASCVPIRIFCGWFLEDVEMGRAKTPARQIHDGASGATNEGNSSLLVIVDCCQQQLFLVA